MTLVNIAGGPWSPRSGRLRIARGFSPGSAAQQNSSREPTPSAAEGEGARRQHSRENACERLLRHRQRRGPSTRACALAQDDSGKKAKGKRQKRYEPTANGQQPTANS